MTTTTYNKVVEITDYLLGVEGMHKYPWILLMGLFLISISLRKYRTKYNIPVFD